MHRSKVKDDFAGRFSNNSNNNQLIAAVISEREQTSFPALTAATVKTVFSDGSLKLHPLSNSDLGAQIAFNIFAVNRLIFLGNNLIGFMVYSHTLHPYWS